MERDDVYELACRLGPHVLFRFTGQQTAAWSRYGLLTGKGSSQQQSAAGETYDAA